MYAADRSCVNTLRQALDMCELLGTDVGVAIDVYHVWWDPELAEQIARAGQMKRIFAHHICDWLVPTKDMLTDRGMMGDGVIDLKGIRRMIEKAGFFGRQLVEAPGGGGHRHLRRPVSWLLPGLIGYIRFSTYEGGSFDGEAPFCTDRDRQSRDHDVGEGSARRVARACGSGGHRREELAARRAGAHDDRQQCPHL
jgi:hypothetical protein